MQQNIRKLIEDYINSGCGDPPPDVKVWQEMPLQPGVQARWDSFGQQRAALIGGAAGAGGLSGYALAAGASGATAGEIEWMLLPALAAF